MSRRLLLILAIFAPYVLSRKLAESSTSLRRWFEELTDRREIERIVTITKVSTLLETSNGTFVLDSTAAELRPGNRVSISFFLGHGGLFQYLSPKRVTVIPK